MARRRSVSGDRRRDLGRCSWSSSPGIWWLASRRPELPDGVAETAAVTALLVFGTLLSPQFVIWPLPFVAIAAGAGCRPARTVGRRGRAVLTLLDWICFDPHHPDLLRSEIVILARNVALVGLLVAAVMALRKPRTRACV